MWVEPLDTFTIRLKAGPVELKQGEPVYLPDAVAVALLHRAAQRVQRFDRLSCLCRGGIWWVSIYGATICGSCHPPVDRRLVVRWITDGHEDGQ